MITTASAICAAITMVFAVASYFIGYAVRGRRERNDEVDDAPPEETPSTPYRDPAPPPENAAAPADDAPAEPPGPPIVVDWKPRNGGPFGATCPVCETGWTWKNNGLPTLCRCSKVEGSHFHLLCGPDKGTGAGCRSSWIMRSANNKPATT